VETSVWPAVALAGPVALRATAPISASPPAPDGDSRYAGCCHDGSENGDLRARGNADGRQRAEFRLARVFEYTATAVPGDQRQPAIVNVTRSIMSRQGLGG
jgi:hypothetical protein